METTDAPDRLLIQFSDGRFAFCPVSGGKIGTLASCPLPHGEEQADALRSLLRQKALQCPEGGATVLYDTDRVCLIPAEYYREEDAERYMTLSGIPGEAERRTVATAPRDGKIALISIARTVYDCLHSAYGDRLAYTHPLLESAVRHARKPLLAAALTRSFVHLSAYDGAVIRRNPAAPQRRRPALLPRRPDKNICRNEFPDRNFRDGRPSTAPRRGPLFPPYAAFPPVRKPICRRQRKRMRLHPSDPSEP